jgi:D-alanyl-D-alanine carboxypeptidase
MTGQPLAGPGVLRKLAPAVLAAVALFLPAEASAHRHHSTHTRIVSGPTDPAKDAALIIDGETGKVLYERNAEATRHPASLTKMMTLYLLFDALHKGQMTLATPMKVSRHASVQAPTKLYLKPGDTISVDDAIKAIVVRSANDVAVTIAEALGGSEPQFADMMNTEAQKLGMTGTFYHNASGLPDPRQISTARDLALLARHLAYDFPQYFHYFSTPAFTFRGRTYDTHDNLIGYYNGADGIKTGYTGASGFNLVSSVVRDRVHLIGVVMGGVTAHRRDNEMMRLLDTAFAAVDKNPTLVARADIPWQHLNDGSANSPVVAGFEIPGMTHQVGATALASLAPQPDDSQAFTDEDAAESADDSDDQGSGDIGGPPEPVKAAVTKPVAAQIKPSAPAAQAKAPAPQPKPVRLASLTPAPAARSAVPAQITAPNARAWTIQIGAYANTAAAREELASYAEKSMDVLGQAERFIVPFTGANGETLYRARFGLFIEREAREVCARLTERGQTCFAALASR